MNSVVDADTHILESSAVWDLIDPEMYPRRPVLISIPNDTVYGGRNAFWLIDGNIVPKPAGKGGFILHTPSVSEIESARTDTTIPCRELTDPEARLRDMDRLSVDVQVVYPTIFLHYLTHDPALEVALCGAYNRWMATVWAKGNGRLRWTTVLPLRNIDASLAQLQDAKEHGAVGVFFRGIEGDRTLDEPYFFPIYQAASELNLPICIHTGSGSPTLSNLFDFSHREFAPEPMKAFRDLVSNKIPEKFPDLRFGFIEATSSWVPFILYSLKRRFIANVRLGVTKPGTQVDTSKWGPSLFRDYRLFVACEPDEDLPYLLNYIGEDNLLVGSDYGHIDPAFQASLVPSMRSRTDLPASVVDKILGTNAKAFYGL